jgi:hypothetical protein
MDGASGAMFLCVSCVRSLQEKHGLVLSESPVICARPSTHGTKRKIDDQIVVQAYGSVDQMGPTSVHEETGAGVETEYTADETEYTADDYELPAGESNSIYYDCHWGD